MPASCGLHRVAPGFSDRVMSTARTGRESIMIIGKERFGSTRTGEPPGRCNVPFAVLSLLVMLLIIYGNSFFGEWHFDDYHNIVDNRNVHLQGLSWQEIRKTFSGTADGSEGGHSTRPLSYLSFGLNYFFGETEVFGYHVVNFVIHFAAAVFLFLFICRTLQLPLLRDALRGKGLRHCPSGDFFLGDEPSASPCRDDHRPADGKPCRTRHDHGPVLLRPGENGRERERPPGICLSLRCRVASGLRVEGKCRHAARLDPPVRRRARPGGDAGKPFAIAEICMDPSGGDPLRRFLVFRIPVRHFPGLRGKAIHTDRAAADGSADPDLLRIPAALPHPFEADVTS